MKRMALFLGKHLWWTAITIYFLLWQFDKPLWNRINLAVTGFFHDTNASTKQARQEAKEISKDVKETLKK